MDMKKSVSVVAPVCNEEHNLRQFYDAIVAVEGSQDWLMEIIFIDDGSTDRSYELMRELHTADPRVKCVRLSRNFGSHAAIVAGFLHCRGQSALILSADLQDPPDLIPTLIRKWQEGNEVVWGVRESRDDPPTKTFLANVSYWLIRKVALPDYPKKGMDFGLFDRRVIDEIARMRETNKFVVGLILWLGFRQAFVPYHRSARQRGTSKWSFARRIKAAVDLFVSFSYIPVRFASVMGLLVSLAALVYGTVLVIRRAVFGLGGEGWPSLMVAILFLGGVQLLTLGILGEYIWRGTEQARARPEYVVMEKVGFDSPTPREAQIQS